MTQPTAPTQPDASTGPLSGAPEAAQGDQSQQHADTASSQETTDWKAEAEKYKALARKHEDRAKTNAGAAAELEKLRQASMSEADKARAEAFEGGRAAERSALTERLVAAEFRAAAALAGRDVQAIEGLLEDLNVTRFVGDDGTVDVERIKARVQALPASGSWPSTGQGAATPPVTAPGAGGRAEAQRRYGQRAGAQAAS